MKLQLRQDTADENSNEPRTEDFFQRKGISVFAGSLAQGINSKAPEQHDGHKIKGKQIRKAVMAENNLVDGKSDKHRVVKGEGGFKNRLLFRSQPQQAGKEFSQEIHEKNAGSDNQQIPERGAQQFRRETVFNTDNGQTGRRDLNHCSGKDFVCVVRPFFCFCEIKTYG